MNQATPVSSSDSLHIVYVPRPTAMTTTTQSPSTTALGGVPDEYHPIIESFVKWKAAEHANDKASGNGQMFYQQWERGISETKVAEMRKAGMLIGEVNIGKGRNPYAYARPGIDLG